MPIYEYKCEACGEEQEISQKISDAPLVKCPLCGEDALERLVSASSFALKGSGWYADGYGGAGKKAGTKPSTEGDSSKSSDSTKSSDTPKKPEKSTTSGSD